MLIGACSTCHPELFKRNCSTCGQPFKGDDYCPAHYKAVKRRRADHAAAPTPLKRTRRRP